VTIAYDHKMFWRTLAMTGVLLGVTVGVVGLTDEPGNTARMRLARISALLPGLASLAGLTNLEQARFRGEIRALSALGRSPWSTARGVASAGWCVGLLAAGLVASGLADTNSLFPALLEPAAWQATNDQFVHSAHGVRISPDGTISLGQPSIPCALGQAPSRGVAVLAIALMGWAAPWWTVTPMGVKSRVFGFALAGTTTITLFHGLAIGVIGAHWLVLAALPLGLQAAHARWTAKPGHGRAFPSRDSGD
jgi:hypothetical protein